MAVGYSKRSLVEKLGVKPDTKIIFLNAPQNYSETLGFLPSNITMVKKLGGTLDFIHFFTKQRSELEKRFPEIKKSLAFDGTIWISWPKKSSKEKTDLNENIVREIGLNNGLVDVKVCAVDEIWSGLKFIYRLQDRK